MLLRTVALLLLCVSTGTCATLGSYLTQEKEVKEELALADQSAEGFAADAAVEDGAAQVVDPPAAEEPVDNTLFDNKLPGEILAVDEVRAADGATDEEPGKDKDDGPAADTSTLDAPALIQELHSPPAEEGNEIRAVETNQFLAKPLATEDNDKWNLNSLRNSFQTAHGYFDSLVELVGGRNGVCQYRCRYGDVPQPRPGYQLPEPNGCSSSLVGFQMDLGIPAMTQCCNQLDLCYDTCGTSKEDCDSEFRSCLLGICSDLKKSLGFGSQVQACDSMADILYNTVGTLGCRPYMNSQRAACVCDGEEKDEL